ncbi:hypothetical protein MOB18_21270 [Bacillus inaquosorum]|uniref:hypothetical protein n=1 Tax=Bacillus inaquosorum TaxID=483913 RepID=UPI00227F5C6E|nr:hypothetical protein [Bacillus inaquosorum]MCY7751594.1 hypothetical protein [Bacillus inaquosorum]
MANLVSVKTLDMVNGEITKVAYGGVEYERVEGEVQKGDLVLIKDGWSFATQGKFYKSVGIDEGGDAKIIDNYGDTISNDRTTYDLFRKLSASTDTSVEERVAKAEDEIESLKSEVATLKGTAEPKPERLKVGDYAKVVQEYHHQNGEIIILRDRGSERSVTFPFQSERLDGTTGDIFGHRHLVRATDEEVAEAKRVAELAKFKEGAKVRLLSGGGEFPLNGYENGKVYEISYAHLQRNRICIIGGEIMMGFATPDQLEILSEEEAAEHKKWAQIGREVGEYRVGDIFRSPGGNLFEITRIDDSCAFPIIFTNLQGDYDGYKRDAAITLVTPVEARFDR